MREWVWHPFPLKDTLSYYYIMLPLFHRATLDSTGLLSLPSKTNTHMRSSRAPGTPKVISGFGAHKYIFF